MTTAERSVPLANTFGLYQGRKLEQVAVSAYREGVDRPPAAAAGLPPGGTAEGDQRPAGALRGAEGLPDARRPGADGWPAGAAVGWRSTSTPRYSGPGAADLRDGANAHVAALLETPVEPPQLDGDLVARDPRDPGARGRWPSAPTRWSPGAAPRRRCRNGGRSNVAGSQVTRVFARASGRPMTDGIEGIYTFDGFHDVFLPAVGDVTRSVAEDGWVLGREQEALSADELDRLGNDLLALYYADYIKPLGRLPQRPDPRPARRSGPGRGSRQHPVGAQFAAAVAAGVGRRPDASRPAGKSRARRPRPSSRRARPREPPGKRRRSPASAGHRRPTSTGSSPRSAAGRPAGRDGCPASSSTTTSPTCTTWSWRPTAARRRSTTSCACSTTSTAS